MDLWVMAAAAAAGYLAKYWQHTAREEGLSGSASPRPINKLSQRAIGDKVLSAPEMVTSTSGYDEGKKKQENEIDSGGNFETGDGLEAGLADNFGIGEMDNLRIGSRSRNCIRSRRQFGCSVVKPLSAIESCLLAQLYKEHVEMEEYVFSSLPSPSTSVAVRPLLVTDGNQIISRSSTKLCSLSTKGGESKLQKKDCFCPDENECVLREESVSMQLPKKPKQKRAKRRYQQHGKLGNSDEVFSDKQSLSQGPPDGMLLLCLGVTIGVVSTVIANKREVEKLNELLKQTKNFVQDLQEELEMKDSLTVKELANEGYDSQETNDLSLHNQGQNLFSSPQEVGKIISCDTKRPEDQTSESNSESMSKIEAELEAELERLELNITASSLDGKLSNYLELDPDLMVDMVHGELRADKVNGVMTDSDRDVSGASTNQQQDINYAVSPRELSLRLHEVIQSRLEERINELENALQNSQRRVMNLMESNQINSWRDYYSSSEKGDCSRESPSPSVTEANKPLFLNLSGDALDAYNEAYQEFDKPISNNEDSPPYMADKNNQFNPEKLDPSEHSVIWDQSGGEQNGSLRHVEIHEESNSSTMVENKIWPWKERSWSYQGTDEFVRNEDENEEDDDSEEMAQLLKQVLEKSRQGSPLVLNAQKLLFSMD